MKTRTKILLSLAAASLLATGCEMLRDREHHEHGYGGGRDYVKPLGGVRGDCANATCNVLIDVSNCGVGEPGELHIHHKGRTQIIFHLTGTDHDFTNNGIDFHGARPFSGPDHPQKGVFRWWDDNDTDPNAKPPVPPKRYKYAINVKKDGGPNCPTKDPDVVNDTPW